MKHLIKENRWECLLYAFAMALDTDPKMLVYLAGHNGSKIVDEDAPEPRGRIGFHAHEITPIALMLGKTATPIQALPVSQVNNREYPIHTRIRERIGLITQLIHNGRGVVTSDHHAMAFYKGVMYDPDGTPPFVVDDDPEGMLGNLADHRFLLKEVWIIK